MRNIDYFNLFIGILGSLLALIAFLKSKTGRHSFNLYVISGIVLIGGGIIQYLTTTAFLKSAAEFSAGALLIIYIFSSQGSIRIRD